MIEKQKEMNNNAKFIAAMYGEYYKSAMAKANNQEYDKNGNLKSESYLTEKEKEALEVCTPEVLEYITDEENTSKHR